MRVGNRAGMVCTLRVRRCEMDIIPCFMVLFSVWFMSIYYEFVCRFSRAVLHAWAFGHACTLISLLGHDRIAP